MAKEHTVQQGDHMSQIAKKYGFVDYKTIWDHADNAELKRKRQNPNVLFPGDVVRIPDRTVREESRPTDQRHRFKVNAPRLKLRIVLEDMYELPIAHAPCDLFVDNEKHELQTDSKGKIEVDIPPTATRGLLSLRTSETALDELAIPVNIGHVDPVDEVTGQKGRLGNLGYYIGPIDATEDDAFKLAVEEFQCEHGLHVDGVCGSQTQAKLKTVHGC
ncbi:MAG TPA: peptidoglycan-binding protein [Methylomirabilota bacterium]